MTTLALIGAGEAGERRVAALEKLASENGLVDIRLVNPRQDPEQIASDCAGAEVLVAPNHQSTNGYAGNISGLKLLQTFSAGTDQLDKHMLLENGVVVSNNGGANAVCVAEHAIWLMITINHKFDQMIESVRAGKWAEQITGPLSEFTTMVDKRVGIVGLGRIGSRVAKRLQGWECEVVYHDEIEFDAYYEKAAGARRVSMEEVVETSDYVSLHVPLDRSTHHLYGAEHFRAMKNTAVLINTCRGPVVDEAALTDALHNKEIWGAGLDVTEVEPTPADNPLISMPNVVITPHTGARVIQSEWNADRNAIQNAERVANGETPNWIVDPV